MLKRYQPQCFRKEARPALWLRQGELSVRSAVTIATESTPSRPCVFRRCSAVHQGLS